VCESKQSRLHARETTGQGFIAPWAAARLAVTQQRRLYYTLDFPIPGMLGLAGMLTRPAGCRGTVRLAAPQLPEGSSTLSLSLAYRNTPYGRLVQISTHEVEQCASDRGACRGSPQAQRRQAGGQVERPHDELLLLEAEV
jgi:hypothetical protein